MDSPSPSIRALARRLLDASQATGDASIHGPALVSERLQASVTKLAGIYGFAALLRRALVLASAEMPALARVSVSADGRLEGLEQLSAQGKSVSEEAALALTTHVLALLVIFIGEPLTQRLVRLSLPKMSVDESDDE